MLFRTLTNHGAKLRSRNDSPVAENSSHTSRSWVPPPIPGDIIAVKLVL